MTDKLIITESDVDMVGFNGLVKPFTIFEGHWSDFGTIFNGRAIFASGDYYIGTMEKGKYHKLGT